MTRSTIKPIACLISQAEADTWHDYKNLARLLSFALKLRDLAYPARIDNHAGRSACRKVVRLLVPLVVDPFDAERCARLAALPNFWRMVKLGNHDAQSPTGQMLHRTAMRRQLEAGDWAYHDAQRINSYVRRLLDLYGVKVQVESEAFPLTFVDEPGAQITPAAMHDWFIWSRYHFFRSDEESLGDILSAALRKRSMDQRVAGGLAALGLSASCF